MDLLDLASDLSKLSARLKNELSASAIEMAKVVHEDLVRETPVDTSTALSNWDLSVGDSIPGPHEAWFAGKRGSTELRSENAAITEGARRLSKKLPGEIVIIKNDVDYIDDLNKGKSKQVAPGFFQRAIAKGQLALRKRDLRLK